MSIYNIALYAALAAVCGLFAAGLNSDIVFCMVIIFTREINVCCSAI